MVVTPNNKFLSYSGRIDFDLYEFVYPCSYVRIHFIGKSLSVQFMNRSSWNDNYLGIIINGHQSKLKLAKESVYRKYTLINGNAEQEYDVIIFKRMDGCHYFRLGNFEVTGEAVLLPVEPKPTKKIEVYGDSVSAGEVVEAIDYEGKPDPENNGEYSNSWYSYAWQTARYMNAEIHNISQGGIALLDNTGWFCEPDAVGLETIFDKIQYNPKLIQSKSWDFSLYRPDIVIVAIGQNDNHPYDYMKDNPNSELSCKWRKHYKSFILKLLEKYPEAKIVLMTTILIHDKSWDDSIEMVYRELRDKRVHHFLFKRNGSGTPGHVRVNEANEMAEELADFIRRIE